MEKITFCINTARNEKSYIELLLQSLLNGIDVSLHDILIFVDSDNQETTEMLVSQHSLFPNLKIVKNKSDVPWRYQMNINYMFDIAETDIVSYLQSDMIVGLDYDKAILKHIKNNMILSSTRVEPPLHCQCDNQVTYVKNFGLTPTEFEYQSFINYSESIKDSNKLTNYFFAPFSLYRKLWTSIGGHDTQFKYSREDSDILYRFCLNKYDIVQCWDAVVYHFTCTSSRGINWWENKQIQQTQLDRDAIELDRFIKKWGQFKHPTIYNHVAMDVISNPDILNNITCKNPPYPTDIEIL
jgi:GT2 family glycosyltransferase